MSEVPIKHFWATPTSALDMTPLTNRIAELQDEVATLTRERDEARRDVERVCQWREDDSDFDTWKTKSSPSANPLDSRSRSLQSALALT